MLYRPAKMVDFASRVRQNAQELCDWQQIAQYLDAALTEVYNNLETGELDAHAFLADGQTEASNGYVVALPLGEEALMAAEYLGTCFALLPSGKYYLPFACSNVLSCPVCKGSGNRPNPANAPTANELLHRAYSAFAETMLELYGFAADWPEMVHRARSALQDAMDRTKPERTCPYCAGLGSREAYLDEIWYESLDAALRPHDLFCETGEGDPCDLYAAMTRDVPEPLAEAIYQHRREWYSDDSDHDPTD